MLLCSRHHNGSQVDGVHFNAPFDRILKRYTQERWMWINGRTEEEFRQIFGRSYL